MSPKKTYVAVYERDAQDDAWNVHIEGLEGCQTYGRSLHQARMRIREALAAWLDRDPDNILVRDVLPTSLTSVADHVAKVRSDAEVAGARAQRETKQAVQRLAALGLSRRDAAELLGLSHQRVQQLLETG